MTNFPVAFHRFVCRRLARFVFALGLVSALAMVLAATNLANALPQISQPLTPSSVKPGSGAFTLTVNGTGFVSASTVKWNGSPRSTTFVSGTQLTAAILASDVTKAATASVTVTSPGSDGGTSNAIFFQIVAPVPTIAFTGAQGVGTFGEPIVGDFNQDGFQDVASVDGGGNLVVHLGNGDGTFHTGNQSIRAGTGPGMVSADFNGDGIQDLAVTNSFGSNKTVAVLLGNGDGTFRQLATYNTGLDPLWVSTGDFNGDGKVDLVVVNQTDSSFSILLGNGDGTFQRHVDTPLGERPSFVTVADFNGDGRADLAIPESSGQVAILLGNGDGTFTSPLLLSVGDIPNQVAVGDFNRDGILDLAVTLSDVGSVAIAPGNGDGTFGAPHNYTTLTSTSGVVLGDFDGDGILDVAAAETTSSFGTGTIAILRGNGDGTFKQVLNVHPNTFTSVGSYLAAGDFNQDGRLDLVAGTLLLQQPKAQSFTPAGLNFNNQIVGTPSPVKQIQISNAGEQPINITSILASGNYSQTNDCGSTLKVFKACKISVTFTPSTIGGLPGSVTVTDDASSAPVALSLFGQGVDLTFSTQHVEFGSVKVGMTSSPKSVTVTNASSTAMTFTSIGLQGNSGTAFSETNTCGTGLSAGATCTITSTFSPTKTGIIRGSVAIRYGLVTQTISLSGTGI